MAGPLEGVRVVELAGLGPAPFCAMVLADLGADVVRIDRVQDVDGPPHPSDEVLRRNRRSVAVDLKHPAGAATVLRLVEGADVLIEGFRPGVTERLGLGPDVCLARNPRLVYGRMTGWGQDGPMAHAAGHDIDYIALTGALAAIGRADQPPVPPLNLIGDFGGGAMFLALGVVAGLFEAARSGRGQVVDAAMVDGSALLMTMIYGMRALGEWEDRRGANLLDTGAPQYDVYETADGGHVAVGAVEQQFYERLVRLTGVASDGRGPVADRFDRAAWPAMKERLAAAFRTRTRDEWCAVFDGRGDGDACVAPVLSMAEAPEHPHLAARGTFVTVEGVVQPAPAPRFSRTPGRITRGPAVPGADTETALADWGLSAGEIADLVAEGAVAVANAGR